MNQVKESIVELKGILEGLDIVLTTLKELQTTPVTVETKTSIGLLNWRIQYTQSEINGTSYMEVYCIERPILDISYYKAFNTLQKSTKGLTLCRDDIILAIYKTKESLGSMLKEL